MASGDLKAIRKRIASVKNTRQITRAMKLVAGAKLKRATDAAVAARPYNSKLNELVSNLLTRSEDLSHPLFQRREKVERIRVVVFTSDRGLCGAYNSNVSKFTDAMVRDHVGKELEFVCVGRKFADHAKRQNYSILDRHMDVAPTDFVDLGRELATSAIRQFQSGKVDEVYLVYQRFRSAISHQVVADLLLPLAAPDEMKADGVSDILIDYIYEPSQQGVIDVLLPQLVANRVMRAFLEANASEHGARMTAMDSATRNASELIDKLTLDGNKARQAAITKELVEIVSGAEAL